MIGRTNRITPTEDKGTRLEMVKIENDDKKDRPTLRLISAAKCGNSTEILKFLENGGDIWEKDDLGRTCLHHLSNLDNGILAYECIKLVLDRIHDSDERRLFVNKEDKRQRIALYWAAAKVNVEVVECLLENGSDPKKLDVNGESALHAAAGNSQKNDKLALECVKRILQSLNNEGKSQLLNSQSSLENLRRTVLHLAVKSGSDELSEYILQNGVNILTFDSHNYNILHLAIQNGIPEKAIQLTKLILKEAEMDSNSTGLNLMSKIDNWGRGPIHLAARQGNKRILELLVEANVNLLQVDKNLASSLHLAASLGNEVKALECVSVLLNNKLSEDKKQEYVNLSNNKGETALYLAAKNLNTEAAKKLLLAGSEFDKKTRRNKTPLEKVYRNVPESLVVLLDEAVERSGYSARDGVISNYAKVDFGPILGTSGNPKNFYRETGELAKICHAKLSLRQPVLNHVFVRIFVWKKWEKVWWCFALSRILHMLWYLLCLMYLMKVYREICPFKSPKNDTVQFSFAAIGPLDATEDDTRQPKNLDECDLSGFPLYGGILLLVGSLIVLIAEIYPTYQRFQWSYKPLKPWTTITFRKNIIESLKFVYEVLPLSQMTIFLLVLLTSPPLFGAFPFSDIIHVALVAAFAFTTCFCIYLELGRIPSCRVYVNLLKKISVSLFFAILVHFPILIGFAAVFVFLLQGMPSFSSVPQAIVKVLTLSIGELDYQNVIYDGELLFKGIEILAFGIFVLFITVVLINFLVGLATDDVKESRNSQKEIWKLCTQIEQVMLLESFLDACGVGFGQYILKEYLLLMPPYRPGEQRRQVEIFIPSLPKQMQKELHNLNLKIIPEDS